MLCSCRLTNVSRRQIFIHLTKLDTNAIKHWASTSSTLTNKRHPRVSTINCTYHPTNGRLPCLLPVLYMLLWRNDAACKRLDDDEREEIKQNWSCLSWNLAYNCTCFYANIMPRMNPQVEHDHFPAWLACWVATGPHWGCSWPASHIGGESGHPRSSTSYSAVSAECCWQLSKSLVASTCTWQLGQTHGHLESVTYLDVASSPRWKHHRGVVLWRPEQQSWWSLPIGAPLYKSPRRECSLASLGGPQPVLVWTAPWCSPAAHGF